MITEEKPYRQSMCIGVMHYMVKVRVGRQCRVWDKALELGVVHHKGRAASCEYYTTRTMLLDVFRTTGNLPNVILTISDHFQ